MDLSVITGRDAEGVADKALQFRARQNIILELGFFYGYLGWENVFVVFCNPKKVLPNLERPSDLDGVVFDTIDATGQWRAVLQKRRRVRWCTRLVAVPAAVQRRQRETDYGVI